MQKIFETKKSHELSWGYRAKFSKENGFENAIKELLSLEVKPVTWSIITKQHVFCLFA